MCEFDKPDKTFASDIYLIYKRSPSARVCISDKDRLLMFYLLHIHDQFAAICKTRLANYGILLQFSFSIFQLCELCNVLLIGLYAIYY